jgi:hypothetical protein
MLQVNQLIGFGDSAGPSGIQFVGAASSGKLGATSGTSTIALNSGLSGGISSAVQSGDFVIGVFATCSDNVNRTLSITDGVSNYTLLGSELYRAAGATPYLASNLRAAYKFVTSDTDTTFGPSGHADDGGATAVYVFRNVNTTTPLDAAVTTATGTGTNANPPSLTPVTAGAFIVNIGMATEFSTETLSSGELTNFISVSALDTRKAILGIGHKPDWTSGAFDAATFSFTGANYSNQTWAALSIALRPA